MDLVNNFYYNVSNKNKQKIARCKHMCNPIGYKYTAVEN